MINIEEQRAILNKSGEDMLKLVHKQVQLAFEAFTSFDTDLAEEVILKEKRVNGLDIRIEKDADNFIALYSPVAIDLRFSLALLKINYHLERIGDQAYDIAKHTIDLNQKLVPELLERMQFKLMFETIESMFKDVITAYTDENLKVARKVFKKDKIINEINEKAFDIVAEDALKNPELIRQYLMALVVMKKFEKVGDLLKNISESIIYFIDAEILKHKKKK